MKRTCPNCNLKIIKEDGSNKMTCMCGNMMCYVCKASVQDYTHFNGQGGSNFNLCPLYNNTREMHAANVRQRARDVMNEVGGNLKIDPTADIDDFL
ncbi:PREDICTED: E3 ubiquitin-protein ligase RNF14-like isoform X2 [Nicrophorus vespilloides]|uniref:E3 ubiquitin-protein ligase RNF14-like isoform X2 n=1 Tax=Nicrophorus vespilloides TaxID=110193 RepID=A0ABM1N1B7_NICVS|nr:PREDICTED: E3 ubiquitin-protein ligase RNF14-like isoform X2 [Nicrophorus vespilloides]